MIMRTALTFLAVGFAAGCTDTTTIDDTGDTDETDTEDTFYQGPWQIESVGYTCAPVSTVDTWTYTIETAGLAGAIEAQLVDSGAWDGTGSTLPGSIWQETHFFDNNTDFDAENGTFDKWELVLKDVATTGEVNPGGPCADGQTTGCTTPGAGAETATTLFDCTWDSGTVGGTGDRTGDSLAWMFTMLDDSSPAVTQDCIIFGKRSTQIFNTIGGNDCLCFEGDTAANCEGI